LIRCLAAILLLCPAVVGCAAEEAESLSLSEAAFIEGEQLLAQPPVGWQQTFSSASKGLRMAQFIPEQEDAENWVHKISFESLADQPLPDPSDFLELISSDQQRQCPDFEGFDTFSGLENGYPTSVQLHTCPRNKNTDKSAASMIKVIRGNDYFYIVTRSQQGDGLKKGDALLTETQVAAWSLYLRTVGICDTTRPEHPCPQR
jgi:hypothetical protein